MKIIQLSALCGMFISLGCAQPTKDSIPESISGIYPKLAYYNQEGECGTGAVVPWADRLWVITYGPHLPFGSSDKLYEITPDRRQIVRNESVGGTPANRMIHRESNQLFIGPYVIDTLRNVRVIDPKVMPGRHTGNARHLTDPANKIYYGTMEEGFYEVDVHSLNVRELYQDRNVHQKNIESGVGDADGKYRDLLPGVHGKGLYSGQGVMVFTNNGEGSQEALEKFDVEAGVLAEWDGNDWKVIRRNQFVEVTGPGGIYGNQNPETDPLWATGWDHKSLLLGVRDAKEGWSFYRLPKASHSYDGAHGWNTEWPRIRDVGTDTNPEYMMTMHGMFWHFPQGFTATSSAGIRPRSAYLKVIGDFTRWQDQLVFGCDDSAQKEFLNKRAAKGTIEGPGQSNSNLWFTSFEKPDELGPSTAEGAVWSREAVTADNYSEPFLFSGWTKRCGWIRNEGDQTLRFNFEVDRKGINQWSPLREVEVGAGKSMFIDFSEQDKGEWIRVKTNKNGNVTLWFNYTNPDQRTTQPDPRFRGLAALGKPAVTQGLLYGLGMDRRALGIVNDKEQDPIRTGYYEMGDQLALASLQDSTTASDILNKCAIPSEVITVDAGSVLVVDDHGRRWRLPLGDARYTSLIESGQMRICREVATERDLFHSMGTFYELPAENADGYAKIRPISTHPYQIHDYASYRGMLVMTGVDPDEAAGNAHVVVAPDGKTAVWCGVIDDLWSMGKPVGKGGPWVDTPVESGIPSDPYLIGFYDKKQLSLSHDGSQAVNFIVEVDPGGNGNWMEYQTINVAPGKKFDYTFPDSFQARWIRFRADQPVKATAWLEYL